MSRAVRPNPTMRTFVTPLLFLLAACENFENLASRPPRGDAGGMDAALEEDAGQDAGSNVGTNEAGTTVAMCGSQEQRHVCACSNGIDDDLDNEEDGFDSECTGPFDDFEDTFRVNSVNEGNPNCSDCFYDDNSRSSDDDCDISSSCIPDGTPAMQQGNRCNTCDASARCTNNCERITPNGCDCFGCCEVTHQGMTLTIRLEATCTVERIANPTLCRPCKINDSCKNTCEPCELCPGRRREDLPPECAAADGGLPYSCRDGSNVCSQGMPCGPSEYCSQGCCVPIILL